MKHKRLIWGTVLTIGLGCGWVGAQIDLSKAVIYQKMIHMTGDLRVLNAAIETYYIDHSAFPFSTAQTGQPGIAPGVPTFGSVSEHYSNGHIGVNSLTTPVAYASRLPVDSFAEDGKRSYAYATTGSAYLIWSAGPDKKFDMNASDFDIDAEKQSPEFHASYSYDPSNGLISSGDLWFSRHDKSAILTTLEANFKQKPKTSLGLLGFLHEMASIAKPVTPKMKLEDAKANMRTIATALETYNIDNAAYPVFTTNPEEQFGPETLISGVPTFHKLVPDSRNKAFISTLTSPIAYLAKMPQDPYVQDKVPFAYINRGDKAWLLWSPGPDGKYDVDLDDFTSETTWPAPEFMAKYAYDASNGVVSYGDVLRMKQ